jgi:hypothetical protein
MTDAAAKRGFSTMTTATISAPDTAKLVRKALKTAFPGQKFSVRTDTYAGGASIRVTWTDGPRRAEVEPVATVYAGGRFDGMIDLAYSVSHYLKPDGSVMIARDPGTGDSGGSNPQTNNLDLRPAMPADVQIVRFGADYIFCDREISGKYGKHEAAETWLRGHCILEEGDRFLGRYVTDLAWMMVRDQAVGEEWAETFKRI